MDFDELDIEIEEMNSRINDFEAIEKDGYQNIIKYFDRIHDKLFSFNNIMIGGYFCLVTFKSSISFTFLIIPLINMLILVFIDYSMMERSRVESKIMSIPLKEHENYKKSIDKTNIHSLFAIISTLVVIGVFLWQVYSIPNANVSNSEFPKTAISGSSMTNVTILKDSLQKEINEKVVQVDTTKIILTPLLKDSFLQPSKEINFLPILQLLNSK